MTNTFRLDGYVFSLSESQPNQVWVSRKSSYGQLYDGVFELQPNVRQVGHNPSHSYGRFSEAESHKIVSLIRDNFYLFNFEALSAYQTMPDHHCKIDSEDKTFAAITEHFNPEIHWQITARLGLHLERNVGSRFTRSFFLDSLTSPLITNEAVSEWIESTQDDFFTYDDPPDPAEYFQRAKVVHQMERLGFRRISAYSVEEVPEVFFIQAYRKRGSTERMYVARDENVYRPVGVPMDFIGENGFIFML